MPIIKNLSGGIMVSFSGYEDIIKKVYEEKQEHVFRYWEGLEESERKLLLDDLKGINFELLKELHESSDEEVHLMDFNPCTYIHLPESDSETDKFNEARKAGIDHIKKGKVAAFIVAGGQGSRLGFEGPKGIFPVGPVSGKTLFEIHAQKIKKYSEKYSVNIPWFVMTSVANHNDTVQYFEENEFFALGRENVFIFQQNMIPSLDMNGKLVLESKNRIFRNPDGHGGSLTALYTSGALSEMKNRGIDIISYFQVDNPLVKIIDPVFIGFHVLNSAEISSKALKKAYPGEKVGVFVEFENSRVGVVEYSDLPQDKAEAVDENGDLLFSGGSIAIHLFDREFVERLTSESGISLPFHTAKKKIKSLGDDGFREVPGHKFEKFVFDALPLSDKNIVIETRREEEFAPVKNASGVDSVETATKLMIDLSKEWLSIRGYSVPETSVVEISPLAATEPEDIEPGLEIPLAERIYITRENGSLTVKGK